MQGGKSVAACASERRFVGEIIRFGGTERSDVKSGLGRKGEKDGKPEGKEGERVRGGRGRGLKTEGREREKKRDDALPVARYTCARVRKCVRGGF